MMGTFQMSIAKYRNNRLKSILYGAVFFMTVTGAFADSPATGSMTMPSDMMPMTGQDGMPMEKKHDGKASEETRGMNMDSMEGGSAPLDARTPNAYADGYDYGSVPGMEKADQIRVNKLLVDELEWVHSRDGNGKSWKIRDFYGSDENKLLMRTDGMEIQGKADFTTGGEALWWRALTPFWGTVLGVRQEFGSGAHTQAALGIEGIAPYWFEVEATGYVDEYGRFSARFQGTYDLLLTNRLILTPEIGAYFYSRTDPIRNVGSGLVNSSAGLRLRYEFSRSFAPYVGINSERNFRGTGGPGEPKSATQYLVGFRMLI